jgi:hypothetical protein
MAAVTHVKSNSFADYAGPTITGFNSAGATTAISATDLIRPSDWNSGHQVLQTISSNTGGDTSVLAATNVVFGGTNAVTLRASTGGAGAHTLWFDAPRDFTASVFQPRSFITGSAYSSHDSRTTYWQPMFFDDALGIKAAFVQKSISMAFPAGTSSNTTQEFRHFYTHAVSLFKRKDYANSSLSLTYLTHGSFVATLRFTHNSTSMCFTLSYNTDSAGGTSTYQTTSNATANLAAFFNGPRMIRVPMPATTLTGGEYWIAQAHSSNSSATSGTATVMISYSNLHLVDQLGVRAAMFATSNQTNATSESLGPYWPVPRGVANAHTSNADMNMSAISHNTLNDWWINFVNFP